MDFEQHRSYNLTVRALDPVNGGYADTLVRISVTDVNDNPPVFIQQVSRVRVSEAAVPGSIVTKVLQYCSRNYIEINLF